MNRSNTNPCDKSIRIAVIVVTSIFSIAMATKPVAAQNTQTGTQQTGGTGTGGQTQAGLNPDQAFEGGVQRGGAVGQSTAGPVGASATSSAAGAAGAAGGRASGGFGGGGLGAAFNSLFNSSNSGGNNSTPALRTRLRSAVEMPPMYVPYAQSTQVSVSEHLQNVTTLQSYSGAAYGNTVNPYQSVNVQVQGSTAILQGSVGSESQRRMSTLLMRLEPGVSQVQNRLRIQP